MSTLLPSLLPLDLESFRIGFAAIAGIMTVAHLPWFARSIGILRSGLAQVSTPLDDDMENIATEELPGAGRLPASAIPTLPLWATVLIGSGFSLALFATAFGWWPRTMLVVAAVLHLLFFRQALATSKVARKTSLLPWTCLLLALAPANGGGDALTVVAIKILLAHMWFTAGLRKLQNAGWRWSEGSTLRHHLATEALENRTQPHDSMGMWIARRPRLCALLAGATLFVELASPLVILPTVLWACAVAYLIFLALHLGIWLLWGLDYLSFCFLPIGLILLVPTDLPGLADELSAGLDWRTVATLAIAGFFIANTFLGIERWPVHDWPMFSGSIPWGHVRVRRLVASHDGRRSPMVLRDRYQNRGIARHGRYLLWYGEQWARERNIDPVAITQLELIETTIDEDGRVAEETLMTFERLTQLRRWLWRPPWEETTRRDSS